MSQLVDAMRAKYKTPRAALRALGLDEDLIEPAQGEYLPIEESLKIILDAIERTAPEDHAALRTGMQELISATGLTAEDAPPHEHMIPATPDPYAPLTGGLVERPSVGIGIGRGGRGPVAAPPAQDGAGFFSRFPEAAKVDTQFSSEPRRTAPLAMDSSSRQARAAARAAAAARTASFEQRWPEVVKNRYQSGV